MNFLKKFLHIKAVEDFYIIKKWCKSHFTIEAFEDYVGALALGIVLGIIMFVVGGALFGLVLLYLLIL